MFFTDNGIEAWDDLLFGRGEDFSNGRSHSEPDLDAPLKTCKYCGKRSLHWEPHRGGWRLFGKKGKLHDCLNKDTTK